MKKFTWFIISLLLIIATIIFYNKVYKASPTENKAQEGKNKEMKTTGFIVKSQKLSNQLEAGGILFSSEEVELHPEISGRVVRLNIDEGNFVKQGILLVKINDAELQAQLLKQQAQKQIAEKNEQRLKELLAINGIGQQEYDAALLQLNNIKADIEITKAQLDKTEVRAPFSGKLGLKKISAGAYVTPNTVIASLQQVDPLKLDFFIPEKYSSQIKKGAIVKFKTDNGKTEFSGRIYAIEPRVDDASRSIQVRASVDNSKGILNPGAFTKIIFDIDDVPDALLIPSQCIIPEAKGKKVILCKNGKAEYRKVIIGLRSESNVQIIEGLQGGDTIVVTGLMFIKPEMKLTFPKIMNAETNDIKTTK